MKNLTFFLVLAALLTSACNNRGKKKIDSKNLIRKSLVGNTYFGVTPCASCPGIETKIIFTSDSTVTEEFFYQSENEDPFIENGRWFEKDSIITLDFSTKEDNLELLIKPNNQLAILGRDRKEIQGELAEEYILTKINKLDSSEVNGIYLKGQEGEGYYDKLIVKNLDKENYEIEISSNNTENGCNFKGSGILNANRIIIDLNNYQKDMTSKMTVTFKDNEAFIYVNERKKSYDLMYFCGGGGSLAGIYKKQKK